MRQAFQSLRPFLWGSFTAFVLTFLLIGGTTARRSGILAGWYSVQSLTLPISINLVTCLLLGSRQRKVITDASNPANTRAVIDV